VVAITATEAAAVVAVATTKTVAMAAAVVAAATIKTAAAIAKATQNINL
jgi:hypothetical protein